MCAASHLIWLNRGAAGSRALGGGRGGRRTAAARPTSRLSLMRAAIGRNVLGPGAKSFETRSTPALTPLTPIVVGDWVCSLRAVPMASGGSTDRYRQTLTRRIIRRHFYSSCRLPIARLCTPQRACRSQIATASLACHPERTQTMLQSPSARSDGRDVSATPSPFPHLLWRQRYGTSVTLSTGRALSAAALRTAASLGPSYTQKVSALSAFA